MTALRGWVLAHTTLTILLASAIFAVVVYVASGGGPNAIALALTAVLVVAFAAGMIYSFRRIRPPT